MNNNQKKYYNPSTILTVAIIAFIFVSSITIFSFSNCLNEIKVIQKENIIQFEKMLESLEIHNSKDKFDLIINKDAYEKISTISDTEYKNFLVQYNEIQANWLNIWLTILGLALAFLGLIVPICFMKLYEDKKNEMDKVIQEAKEQKANAELSIGNVQLQLSQINMKSESLSNELSVAKSHEEQITSSLASVKEYLDETRENADRVSKDLEAVKEYVNKSKALSKANEALNYINLKENNRAKELIKDAYELCKDDDSIIEMYAIHVLFDDKKYEESLELLNRTIDINPDSYNHYYNRTLPQIELKQYKEAVNGLNIALEKCKDNIFQQAYCYSRLAVAYAHLKEKIAVVYNIKQALSLFENLTILNNCSIAAILLEDSSLMIEIINKLVKIEESSINYYNLTEAYILNGQIDDATLVLKKYIELQNENDCWGIYNDDYEKWMNKLNSLDTQSTKELIELVNSLKKRARNI